ncbi:vegetative cell wall protein gp1 [Triticum aestivum]|uniref:vegetative cell wall protein gp1 n=1 Tax=Triticum aestivum TaxID=4565 RepID=UPI001D00BCFD|nr:vegetative cell wall protein gp1-like [Triticum aestivum]
MMGYLERDNHTPPSDDEVSLSGDEFGIPEDPVEQVRFKQWLMATTRSLQRKQEQLKANQDLLTDRWAKVLATEKSSRLPPLLDAHAPAQPPPIPTPTTTALYRGACAGSRAAAPLLAPNPLLHLLPAPPESRPTPASFFLLRPRAATSHAASCEASKASPVPTSLSPENTFPPPTFLFLPHQPPMPLGHPPPPVLPLPSDESIGPWQIRRDAPPPPSSHPRPTTYHGCDRLSRQDPPPVPDRRRARGESPLTPHPGAPPPPGSGVPRWSASCSFPDPSSVSPVGTGAAASTMGRKNDCAPIPFSSSCISPWRPWLSRHHVLVQIGAMAASPKLLLPSPAMRVLCSSSPAAACGFDSRSVQLSSASGIHAHVPPAVHLVGRIFCLRGELRAVILATLFAFFCSGMNKMRS